MSKISEIKDKAAQNNGWDEWLHMDNCELEDWEVAMARQEMITELMELAYNQALNDAANNAKTFKNSNSGSWRDAKVDEQSILKLKI